MKILFMTINKVILIITWTNNWTEQETWGRTCGMAHLRHIGYNNHNQTRTYTDFNVNTVIGKA